MKKRVCRATLRNERTVPPRLSDQGQVWWNDLRPVPTGCSEFYYFLEIVF